MVEYKERPHLMSRVKQGRVHYYASSVNGWTDQIVSWRVKGLAFVSRGNARSSLSR